MMAKRKFAGVLMIDHNARVTAKEDKVRHAVSVADSTGPLFDINALKMASSDAHKDIVQLPPDTQAMELLAKPSVVSAALSASPIIPNNENASMACLTDIIQPSMSAELTALVSAANASTEPTVVGQPPVDATKPEAKERKRRIRIDDDDESPTFNPMARGVRRGRGRGGRGSRGARGALKGMRQQRTPGTTGVGHNVFMLSTPEKSHDGIIFTTPEGKVSPPLYHIMRFGFGFFFF